MNDEKKDGGEGSMTITSSVDRGEMRFSFVLFVQFFVYLLTVLFSTSVKRKRSQPTKSRGSEE